MKTNNLTWPQARNYLKSGMAPMIQYETSYRNQFKVSEGKLYRRMPEGTWQVDHEDEDALETRLENTFKILPK